MVSERARNIFEYLCAVLNDGLASLEDVRDFIGGLRELSESEVAFLEGAFLRDVFAEPPDKASGEGPSSADEEE